MQFAHASKITLAVRQLVARNVPSIPSVSSIKHVSITNVSTHVLRRSVVIRHAVKLSITILSVVVLWVIRVIHLFDALLKRVSFHSTPHICIWFGRCIRIRIGLKIFSPRKSNTNIIAYSLERNGKWCTSSRAQFKCTSNTMQMCFIAWSNLFSWWLSF